MLKQHVQASKYFSSSIFSVVKFQAIFERFSGANNKPKPNQRIQKMHTEPDLSLRAMVWFGKFLGNSIAADRNDDGDCLDRGRANHRKVRGREEDP